ncbi:hypothetical protein NHX12_025167 [Muraenolepis orangiensis]|uniref:Uncharacterized protein n=1 Tax=Muraenolepis orangiensis TaxID=630683 RepID=A0A9Q0EPD4_9TELE|nr:hypothetical protein NHX12_025167 [Muraenolepis orangiensis]
MSRSDEVHRITENVYKTIIGHINMVLRDGGLRSDIAPGRMIRPLHYVVPKRLRKMGQNGCGQSHRGTKTLPATLNQE